VAAGGVIRIVNGCRVRSGIVEEVRLPENHLARIQVLEYLRSFLAGRMGWDALDATLIISGAFGMFQRTVVTEAGGYATDTVGEDMELVVRLHRFCRAQRRPYRVAFVPDPVAWTECPESLRVLGRQRDRWQRGLVESLWSHRVMLLNPRYGKVGLVAFPYFFFLEVFGPIIEGLGYVTFVVAVVLGRASIPYVAAFVAVAFAFGIALSFAAVGLEELSLRRYPRFRDLLRLLGVAFTENVGYRQLSTYWRIRGMVSKLRGARAWGAMERKGFRATGATE
jgi:cellulose synthase/poly-beta-1,6-N-acetylglucosamine synthase-like glycosyltransferase